MRLALIVQGPVNSTGLSGKTWGKGKSRAPKNNFVTFNASSYIDSNLQRARKHFDILIYVSNCKEDTIERFSSVGTIYLTSPDPGVIPRKQRIFHNNFADNSLRQFVSFQEGLRTAKNLGGTHALKIRSDQLLDLQTLGRELKECFSDPTNANKIFVPFRDVSVPWSVPDFYLGGQVDNLIELSNLMTLRKKFHNSLHIDLCLKYLLIRDPEIVLRNLERLIFAGNIPPVEVARVLAEQANKYFIPGSSKVFYSIEWRGSIIENTNANFLFHDSINREIQLKKLKSSKTHPNLYLQFEFILGSSSLLAVLAKVVSQIWYDISLSSIQQLRWIFNSIRFWLRKVYRT